MIRGTPVMMDHTISPGNTSFNPILTRMQQPARQGTIRVTDLNAGVYVYVCVCACVYRSVEYSIIITLHSTPHIPYAHHQSFTATTTSTPTKIEPSCARPARTTKNRATLSCSLGPTQSTCLLYKRTLAGG